MLWGRRMVAPGSERRTERSTQSLLCPLRLASRCCNAAIAARWACALRRMLATFTAVCGRISLLGNSFELTCLFCSSAQSLSLALTVCGPARSLQPPSFPPPAGLHSPSAANALGRLNSLSSSLT